MRAPLAPGRAEGPPRRNSPRGIAANSTSRHAVQHRLHQIAELFSRVFVPLEIHYEIPPDRRSPCVNVPLQLLRSSDIRWGASHAPRSIRMSRHPSLL